MAITITLKRTLTRCLAAAALVVAAGSCLGWPPSEPPPPPTTTLAVCPTPPDYQTQTASGTIGILGGTVSLGGTSVVLPLGALLSPTSIELTIPASQYMEIGVTANGGSFNFLKAISITIDYSRCSSDIQQKQLSVWHIDPSTHELLENMGGVDNKLTHQITFTTLHLSGYALAF
jgi:hypothetical protein